MGEEGGWGGRCARLKARLGPRSGFEVGGS